MSDFVEFIPFQAKSPIKLSGDLVRSLLCKPTKQGHVCGERDAIRFVMFCKARELNPWEGDAFIVGYDAKDGPEFNLITAVQAFYKRAEIHPNYDGHESGTIVRDAGGNIVDRVGDFTFDDDVLLGGWATVHLKNCKYPTRARLKLSTFSTGYARWNKDPAGMIVKCAEADAFRRSFPTALGGMYLSEEFSGDVIDARPIEPPKPPDNGRMNLALPKNAPPPKMQTPEPPPQAPEPAAQDNDASGQSHPDEPPSMEEVARDEERRQFEEQTLERIATAKERPDFGAVSSQINADIARMQPTIGDVSAEKLFQENIAAYQAWAKAQPKPAGKGGKAK